MNGNNRTPHWLSEYNEKKVSSDEALKVLKSGDKVFVQPGCAVPFELCRAMVRRKDELEDVQVYHILAVGDLPYIEPGMEKHFHHTAFFIGHNTRRAINEGRADFVPCFLHEVPLYFKQGIYDVDVCLIHVSPPDEHGFCSFGTDIGTVKTPSEMSKIIIAQVNKRMPRTLGNSFIHISKMDYIVEHDEELTELPQVDEDTDPEYLKIYDKIGENIADLIDDGSTLQMGIGAIPDSVLKFMMHKKNLGVHTEMFSDGLIALMDKGIVNGEKKSIHPGKVIAGFILGTRRAFDYAHNNPSIEFHPQEYVNDPYVIAQNYKMVAINSAIEIDLTGQVCSDSIGTRLYSGFGGQVDFIRGAARSEGGKPIIAIPSATKDLSMSKIVPMLKQGAGVVTSRADVHYVVTEYGVANLHGKSIRERNLMLIDIAHPKFRDELRSFAKKTHNI